MFSGCLRNVEGGHKFGSAGSFIAFILRSSQLCEEGRKVEIGPRRAPTPCKLPLGFWVWPASHDLPRPSDARDEMGGRYWALGDWKRKEEFTQCGLGKLK